MANRNMIPQMQGPSGYLLNAIYRVWFATTHVRCIKSCNGQRGQRGRDIGMMNLQGSQTAWSPLSLNHNFWMPSTGAVEKPV